MKRRIKKKIESTANSNENNWPITASQNTECVGYILHSFECVCLVFMFFLNIYVKYLLKIKINFVVEISHK